MNRTLKPLTLLVLILVARPTFSEERILADDGREVLLKDDGSWEYISEDRHATTASGERVRLKAGGSWEIVTDAQSSAAAGGVILSDTGPANWVLQDVIIETARSQRGGGKKGVTKKTQTIFTLELRRKPGVSESPDFTLDTDNITVVDSGGREYPVLSVEPPNLRLDSGDVQRVVVYVDGSPHWFSTRYFQLTIAAHVVGNADEIRLKRALANVRKREVDK